MACRCGHARRSHCDPDDPIFGDMRECAVCSCDTFVLRPPQPELPLASTAALPKLAHP